MTCEELGVEERVLLTSLDAHRSAVDEAYDSDKNTELVAWLLFFPAAFMYDGNQEEGARFAATKGQYDAVKEAQSINKCVSVSTKS